MTNRLHFEDCNDCIETRLDSRNQIPESNKHYTNIPLVRLPIKLFIHRMHFFIHDI